MIGKAAVIQLSLIFSLNLKPTFFRCEFVYVVPFRNYFRGRLIYGRPCGEAERLCTVNSRHLYFFIFLVFLLSFSKKKLEIEKNKKVQEKFLECEKNKKVREKFLESEKKFQGKLESKERKIEKKFKKKLLHPKPKEREKYL